MRVESVSGQPNQPPRQAATPDRVPVPDHAAWRQWRSLRGDILRHVYARDRQGAPLTLDQLAEDLDEALGLVERRAQELARLGLIRCLDDRRVTLPAGSERRCG